MFDPRTTWRTKSARSNQRTSAESLANDHFLENPLGRSSLVGKPVFFTKGVARAWSYLRSRGNDRRQEEEDGNTQWQPPSAPVSGLCRDLRRSLAVEKTTKRGDRRKISFGNTRLRAAGFAMIRGHETEETHAGRGLGELSGKPRCGRRHQSLFAAPTTSRPGQRWCPHGERFRVRRQAGGNAANIQAPPRHPRHPT